jgi:hypothetical protein
MKTADTIPELRRLPQPPRVVRVRSAVKAGGFKVGIDNAGGKEVDTAWEAVSGD